MEPDQDSVVIPPWALNEQHDELPQLLSRRAWPPSRVWMLSPRQYTKTVDQALGLEEDEAEGLLAALEAVPGEGKFVFTSELDASSAHASYLRALMEAGQSMVDGYVDKKEDIRDVKPCFEAEAEAERDACLSAWIAPLAERFYRREPSSEHVEELRAWMVDEVAPLYADLDLRWRVNNIKRTFLLRLMLSPQTIYRQEFEATAQDEYASLSDEAWLEAVSYFLRDAPPSLEEMTRARSGELGEVGRKEELVRAIMQDPESLHGLHRLLGEMIDVHDLDEAHVQREAIYYPDYSAKLLSHMRREVDLYTRQVFALGGNLRDIYLSQRSMVSHRLSDHYGLGLNEEAFAEEGFISAELPVDQRRGLLTLAAFSTVHGGPSLPSPIERGIFMRERMLCQIMPPPPPEADFMAPLPAERRSIRDQLAEHSASADCAACHLPIDGLGFAFDSFDSMGAWRDQEQAYINKDPLPPHAIRSDGAVYLSSTESSKLFDFEDTLDFVEKLTDAPLFQRCVLGRLSEAAAGHVIEDLQADPFDQNGYISFEDYITELLTHPDFITRSKP